MNNFICLDSCIIIKVLTWEEDSEKAVSLFDKIIKDNKTILIPDFSSVEVGSVLRKKIRIGMLDKKDANILWESFINMDNIKLISFNEINELTWEISNIEDLPTLYDAAFLALCEKYEVSEFWTADRKLINSVSNKRDYIKSL